MIFIALSIVMIVIGSILFLAGFITKKLNYWTIGSCLLFISLPCIIISVNAYKALPEIENNFLYKLDPKQEYYLIENNNGGSKRLDTVPYGHLEEYIATDNL